MICIQVGVAGLQSHTLQNSLWAGFGPRDMVIYPLVEGILFLIWTNIQVWLFVFYVFFNSINKFCFCFFLLDDIRSTKMTGYRITVLNPL